MAFNQHIPDVHRDQRHYWRANEASKVYHDELQRLETAPFVETFTSFEWSKHFTMQEAGVVAQAVSLWLGESKFSKTEKSAKTWFFTAPFDWYICLCGKVKDKSTGWREFSFSSPHAHLCSHHKERCNRPSNNVYRKYMSAKSRAFLFWVGYHAEQHLPHDLACLVADFASVDWDDLECYPPKMSALGHRIKAWQAAQARFPYCGIIQELKRQLATSGKTAEHLREQLARTEDELRALKAEMGGSRGAVEDNDDPDATAAERHTSPKRPHTDKPPDPAERT